MKFLTSLVCMLAFVGFTCADTTPTTAQITLNGEGSYSVAADVAYIHLSLISESKNAADALKMNSVMSNNVFNTLQNENIKKEEISTSSINISPIYSYKENRDPEFLFYRATHSMRITVCDISKTGKLLDKLVSDGANKLQGITFGTSEKTSEEAMKQARLAAVEDINSKRDLYSKALKLGKLKIKNVSESSGGTRESVYRMAPQLADAPGGRPTKVEGGMISFRANLNIVYEIEP